MSTEPTVGVEIDKMTYRGVTFVMREVGSAMMSTWESYCSNCAALMYVIDASNKAQVSTAAIQFLNILRSSKFHESKPIMLILNKQDVRHCMSRLDLASLMRLNDITKTVRNDVHILETSAYTGRGVSELLGFTTKVVFTLQKIYGLQQQLHH
eukprot:TRINITY_DN66460_c7_g2_i1.p3 TRINITY_DN66460_c7_g2~~TRINITY_DN66460_c7_g2_i1.p3  ORF type:complete len:153 (-),score=81.49 TRINITY_DN66460_c7_g2_i1:176-634(-)